MTAKIIAWPSAPEDGAVDVRGRLTEVLAIFRAIEAGELLAALPDCEYARTQHRTAIALLAIAERQISQLALQVGVE